MNKKLTGDKRRAGTLSTAGISDINPRPRSLSVDTGYSILIDVTGDPKCLGNLPTRGRTISIRGYNGTTSGNSGCIYISGYPEGAKFGPNYALPPGQVVQWAAVNLNQIWITGDAGDGVQVSIR